MRSLTIVIPTYNEVENIATLLPLLADVATRNPDFSVQVCVVDDSSPDRTADAARVAGEALETASFSVRVLSRASKDGLGAAYVWAFGRIVDAPDAPDYVLQMDADLSHDPRYIDEFLQAAREGADFVVASRYIPGGSTPDWTLDRKFLSRGGNLYTRFFLGSGLTDYTGGFNLFSSDLLRRIDFTRVSASGYGFQIVLKYRALNLARTVREIPIVFMDRTVGTSKIPTNTLRKNLVLVLSLRFGRAAR
ncbi:polyprenol monophosphomannose synthase [Rathayibacter sp. AY1G1]|uniref:polyprenol monophosphomannose synthase n=1 Tax=unclassified Rathayibacter TaxID=2609250 RepID=UPI000CE8EFA7|nr:MULTISPECIES: polyprenol monophosphomannose synthase [unclassified Rathayibacter]PPH15915.1 polyprenol monophosphomannose synthase [Rathayibacter sp. AY1G1]PPH38624.1 polyprenol monophosphomannose synthase [Rathayibacter sp. AY1E3]PPH94258.1 polyprenol monophosphomannose synthase [Rathayibacter sp. AY1D3]